ncbi:MAG: TIGR02996 domain-containing protein [Myxococcales bacterium]|nr:TIGR02996 domain-containing protein [Myxococcales bacterium]
MTEADDEAAFESALTAAEDACAARLGAATLDALLAAWRARRAPALTDAIEQLSRRYEGVVPFIDARTERARYERLLDLVARRRAIDVPVILAELPHASLQRARHHLDRISVMDPDPRIARALLDHVAKRRWNPFHKIWTAIFREIRRHGDVRIREALAAQPMPGDELGGAEILRARIRHALERLPASLPVTPAQGERLARLREAVLDVALDVPVAAVVPVTPVGRDEAALIAEMVEKPDDDAVRLVLADLYIERGDVRGELIQLQIKNARSDKPRVKDQTRERQILRQHLVELLGPIEPIVDRKTCRFERGFLHHAALKLKTTAQRREFLGHPLLGTLASVETRDVAVLRHPNLAHVVSAQGVPWKVFVELAHGAPLARLRRVSVVVDGAASALHLDHLEGLPALEAVEIVVPSGPVDGQAWAWLLSEAGGLLTSKALTVVSDPHRARLGAALAILTPIAAVRRFTLGLLPYGGTEPVTTLRLERAADGWDVFLEGSLPHFAFGHQHDGDAPWPDIRLHANPTASELELPPVRSLVRALGDRLVTA